MSLKIKIPKKVSATASFSTEWKMWTLWMRLNRNISGTLEKSQPEPLVGKILVRKLSQEVVMPWFRTVKGNVGEWWAPGAGRTEAALVVIVCYWWGCRETKLDSNCADFSFLPLRFCSGFSSCFEWDKKSPHCNFFQVLHDPTLVSCALGAPPADCLHSCCVLQEWMIQSIKFHSRIRSI